MERLDFGSIEVLEVSVTSPDGQEYILREANGRTAKEHRNAIMDSTVFGPDGRATGVKGLAGVEAKFVSGCMWKVDGEGKTTKNHPPVDLIESWPARVQKQLYEKAKELSDVKESDAPPIKALKAALSREDSPITLEEFTQWVQTLAGTEYKPLVEPFLSEKEDEVKN